MNKEQIIIFSSFALSLVALLLVVLLFTDKYNLIKPRTVVQTIEKTVVVTPTTEPTATPSAVIRKSSLPTKPAVSPAN